MIRLLVRCVRSVRPEHTRSLCDRIVPATEAVRVRDFENFVPALKPSYNFAAFADQSDILQQLVKLGVDLSKLEKDKDISNFVIGLNFERDVQPYIRFLCDNGVPPDTLGLFFTRNPSLLRETLDDLQTRINYLTYKSFDRASISRILTLNPKVLSLSTVAVDRRLGYFQDKYALLGPEVRLIATRCPRLITASFKLLDLVHFCLKEEMGFGADERKQILLSVPKVFTMNKDLVLQKFDYVHNTMQIGHEHILNFPQVLYCRRSRLEQRHRFLQTLNRAQYDPHKPNFVSLKSVAVGSDADFAANVAKSSLATFDLFLKTL